MSDWIDLQRRLVPVDQPYAMELSEVAWFTPPHALTWEEVLNASCVVVLGEAGSGKTSELRGQAERLRTAGRAAFFLRIEDLAKDGFPTAVEGDPSTTAGSCIEREPFEFDGGSGRAACRGALSADPAVAKRTPRKPRNKCASYCNSESCEGIRDVTLRPRHRSHDVALAVA
jgi:hypothetical protein